MAGEMGGYSEMLKGAGTTAQGVQTGAMGVIQMIQAAGLKKDAQSAAPPLYDPMQMGFLSDLNQKRKSLDVGSGYAAPMNAIGASTAGTQGSIIQGGGGNFAGTMDALLKSERVGQDQQNQVLANGANQQLQYNSMYGELLNKVASRKLQLQNAAHQQLLAEWAQKQQTGEANLMAGMASTSNSLDHEKDNPPSEQPIQQQSATTPVSSSDAGTGAQTEGAAGGTEMASTADIA